MAKERILYCVWTKIDEKYVPDWVEYMDKTHLPDVLNTKLFHSAKRFKVTDGSAPGNYITIYETLGKEQLEKYYKEHATRLRQDYINHFGEKSQLSRIVLEEEFSIKR